MPSTLDSFLVYIAVAGLIGCSFVASVAIAALLRRRGRGTGGGMPGPDELPADPANDPRYVRIGGFAVPGAGEATLPAVDLARALKQTQFAAGVDPARPILGGVVLHARDGGLGVAATDGRRVALVMLPGVACAASFALLLPLRQVATLRQFLAKQNGDLRLQVEGAQVVASGGGRSLRLDTQRGDYPQYWAILPTQFRARVALPMLTLAQALRQRLTEQPVLFFELRSGRLHLEGASEAVDYHGPDVDLLLNGDFLRPLTELKGLDTLTLCLNDSFSPVCLTAAALPGWTYLIMPMQH